MEPIARPLDVVGEVKYGTLVFPIRRGQASSFRRMEEYWENEAEGVIIGAYIEATGDKRWNIDVQAAYAALSYVFLLKWFEVTGREVPAFIHERANAALETARTSTHETNEDEKPKIAYRHFILNALRAGVSEDEILSQADRFYQHVQNRRAHIIHWRNKRNAGAVD